MRSYEFLLEGYKEVAQKFVVAGDDPGQVKQTLKTFKELASRNLIQDLNQKNIDWWGKKSFDDLKRFVDDLSKEKSKTQEKRKKIPGRSINLLENDKWLVVIPLDKDASCFHGKNTDWCTTKPNQSHFENYFYEKGIVLVYCIQKETGNKWAMAFHEKLEEVEYFDMQDQSIDVKRFNAQTGLDALGIIEQARAKIEPEITPVRNKHMDLLLYLRTAVEQVRSRDPKIEKGILEVKKPDLADRYIYNVYFGTKMKPIEGLSEDLIALALRVEPGNINRIANPSEKLQLIAVKIDGLVIKHIENPSEDVQLMAILNDGHAIEYIKNPSEKIQIAAVERNWHSLANIKVPTENTIMAALGANAAAYRYVDEAYQTDKLNLHAVNKDGNNIKYISNPSEKLQLLAVHTTPESVRFISNPSEKTQRIAARGNGWVIGDLYTIGEVSEEVKMEAVQQDGRAIQLIKNPSREVMMAAIKQTSEALEVIAAYKLGVIDDEMALIAINKVPQAIRYLKNPSEAVQLIAVRQNGIVLQWIKNPSEEVQLAALKNNPMAEYAIHNPTGKVKQYIDDHA